MSVGRRSEAVRPGANEVEIADVERRQLSIESYAEELAMPELDAAATLDESTSEEVEEPMARGGAVSGSDLVERLSKRLKDGPLMSERTGTANQRWSEDARRDLGPGQLEDARGRALLEQRERKSVEIAEE